MFGDASAVVTTTVLLVWHSRLQLSQHLSATKTQIGLIGGPLQLVVFSRPTMFELLWLSTEQGVMEEGPHPQAHP